jgi:trimeric autotransporter adhesin
MSLLRHAPLAARGLFAAILTLTALHARAAAPDLAVVTNDDGVTTVVAGTTLTYTIQITNLGTADATGATVADSFAPIAASVTWFCVGSTGSSCTSSGTGDISDTVNILAGGSVFYSVSVQTSPSATGTFANSVTVSVAGDTNLANNTLADATDTFTSVTDVGVLGVSDGVASVTPGLSTVTYQFDLTNNGPSTVFNETVLDTVTAFLSGVTWTCTADPGSSCGAAAGAGDLNTTATIFPLTLVHYAVTGTVKSSVVGTMTNTVTVSAAGDTSPGNNSASDTDTVTPLADLAITVTDGVTTAAPGGSVTYTITASNAGPSDVTGATVADTFPASLTTTWTCVGAGGGTCTASGSGNINNTVNLPAGGSVTYTVSATISAGATGTLSNTATVTAPGGVTDPTPGNNSATDSDTLSSSANLAITVTDGVTTATPGGSVTYTITASNAGPSNATGATVADTFPASLTVTWTCVGAGGGTCTASGSGNINDTVNLPAGGSVTYTASATISSAATGTLSNTATVTAPGGVTDPTPGNNSATDSDTLTSSADLAITVTDGVTTATPGGSVTYTITASNAGPSTATGATVADTFPASLTVTWTCVGAGGGTCTASGSGNINNTVNLPAGGSVTYTASATISAAATGTLSNTATVTAPGGVTDPTPGNNSATDSDTLSSSADLAITVTDGVTTATPGGSVTYTITASNAGPSNATGATVADTFPASLTVTWTCVGAGGGTCTASGSGNINNTVNLPSGGSVTYTASATISAAATGTLSNTATITAPGGVTDPSPGNNSATDSDTLAASADLAITVTDGVTTAAPGGSVTYTITASNAGPSSATAATVADTFPAALTATWTCTGAGGGTCTASGSGNINDPVNLPAGGSVTYTVSAAINSSATGTLSNTATVTAPAGVTDPTPGNNSATDTDTLALVFFSGPSATGTGTITAALSGTGGCSFSAPQLIGAPPGSPPVPPSLPAPNITFPQGMFDFSVTGCTPGSTVTLTMTYPQPLPLGTQYWKYGPTLANPTPHWYVLPAIVSGNTATFTIADGGLGDDDLNATNGVIVDQGGPGVGTNGVPTLDVRGLMLLMLFTAMAAALALRPRSGR